MMSTGTKRWGERGNFALLAALSTALMLGFGALVLDVGILYWNHQEEQNIAEAAALAAVKDLDGTPPGLEAARQTAAQLVAANDPSNVFAFNSGSEVEFGVWDGASFSTSNEPLAINAVRVNVSRSQSKGNAVPPILAGVFALFDADNSLADGIGVRNSAVATRDESTSVDCGLAAGDQLTMSGTVDLRGNACSNGNVTASGTVNVEGDLSCGPDSTLTTSGRVSISGSSDCAEESLEMPPVDMGSFSSQNDNDQAVCSSPNCIVNNNLLLSGQHFVTLPAGDYYFNNISVSGQGRIIVTGDVNIYVDGSMSIAGQGFLNSSQDPDNLEIFVDGGSVSLSGTADFFGHVYAPESQVSLSGTADYHGSLTGEGVSVSGTMEFSMEGAVPVGSSGDGGRSYLVQ